jgi:hypothetical protein
MAAIATTNPMKRFRVNPGKDVVNLWLPRSRRAAALPCFFLCHAPQLTQLYFGMKALHAVSVGYSSNDYQAFRGWEEGVVEKLQRLMGPNVMSRLGVSHEESIWQLREAVHPYNDYIDALEDVCNALGIAEGDAALQFYVRLLGTPIKDRPGLVLGMGYQRDELPRTPFVRAFSAASAVLTRRPL